MIMVDIYVPSTDQEYDFKIDQNVQIKLLIEELAELISQKEHSSLSGRSNELVLCSREKENILPVNYTLAQCGIKTGSRLILV